jgi:hypothetical protein
MSLVLLKEPRLCAINVKAGLNGDCSVVLVSVFELPDTKGRMNIKVVS